MDRPPPTRLVGVRENKIWFAKPASTNGPSLQSLTKGQYRYLGQQACGAVPKNAGKNFPLTSSKCHPRQQTNASPLPPRGGDPNKLVLPFSGGGTRDRSKQPGHDLLGAVPCTLQFRVEAWGRKSQVVQGRETRGKPLDSCRCDFASLISTSGLASTRNGVDGKHRHCSSSLRNSVSGCLLHK